MSKEINLNRGIFSNSPKQWVIALSAVNLLAASANTIYTFRATNRESTEKAPVAVEIPKIKAVTALGRLEPEGETIQLSASPDLGGTRVAQLLVEEGDKVEKNGLIAVLDSHDRTLADVELAKQEVRIAQVNLAIVKAGAKRGEINAQKAIIRRLQAQLQGEIAANNAVIAQIEAQLAREKQERSATAERIQAELINARTVFQRYKKLAQEGAISALELDRYRLDFDTARKRLQEAKASYSKTVDTLREKIKQEIAIATQDINTLQAQIEEAKANLDRITQVRPVDVQQAETEVDKAIAALKQAEEDLKRTYVRAPMTSQVLEINTHAGEMVSSDSGIVELGQTDQMIVTAEVYESDINKVNLEQQATITSETGAFVGELQGSVTEIGRQINKKDVLDTDPAADVDSRVVEVKIRLNERDSRRVTQLTNSKVIVKILL